MKILVSWLRDFVDVTVSPEELGETLTLRGFELSSIERVDRVDDRRSDDRRCRARFRGHRQPARCAQRHRLCARGRHRVFAAGEAAGPEAADIEAHDRRGREAGSARSVPALCGGGRRCQHRALPCLARVTAAGRRRAPHQQRRRRHELRAARARTADARVRPRDARRQGNPDSPRRAGRAHHDARRRRSRARSGDAGHRRRATRRRRLPA